MQKIENYFNFVTFQFVFSKIQKITISIIFQLENNFRPSIINNKITVLADDSLDIAPVSYTHLTLPTSDLV